MSAYISSLLYGNDKKGEDSEDDSKTPVENPRNQGETTSNVKIIAMWAHKGGVAKTTNVYHMAFEMAMSGLTVIMVDGDPQCTLSESCCSTASMDSNWRATEERGDLSSAWEAAYTAILENEKVPAASLAIPDRADLCSKNGGLLYLLPGSLESYMLERRLSYAQDLKQRGWLQDVPGWELLRESIGVTRRLLLATAAQYEADVVLVDMGPSIGDLNFNILFSTDFFIIPANADRYSKSSLYTITSVLKLWAQNHQELLALNRENKCNMVRTPPKFAGIIFSRIPQSNQKKPIFVNAKWMEECCEVVQQVLIPTLDEVNMIADNLGVIEDEGYMLEQIPMFTKVLEMAMRCYAPVFGMEPTLVKDVTRDGKEKLLKGKALDAALEKGNEYLEYFENLNKRLLEVTDRV